jgi:hypothetical protein
MMTADKPIDLKRLLAAFFSARNVSIDADGLRMWLSAFRDLTPEAVATAIDRFNQESTDHPTPAGVRRYAGAAGLTDEQRAQAAWRVVRSAVARYGAYYAISFDDQIIHAAIRSIGGWVNLCNTQHDELQWKAKQFVDAYVNVARSGIGEFHPIAGLLTNQPEPVQITTGLLPHSAMKAIAQTKPAARFARLPNLKADRNEP